MFRCSILISQNLLIPINLLQYQSLLNVPVEQFSLVLGFDCVCVGQNLHFGLETGGRLRFFVAIDRYHASPDVLAHQFLSSLGGFEAKADQLSHVGFSPVDSVDVERLDGDGLQVFQLV